MNVLSYYSYGKIISYERGVVNRLSRFNYGKTPHMRGGSAPQEPGPKWGLGAASF